MTPKRHSLLLLLVIVAFTRGYTQDTTITEVNSFANLKMLHNSEIAYVEKGYNLYSDLSKANFKPWTADRGRVNPKNIAKKILVKFKLSNDSNAVKDVYFFPGFFFDNTTMYRLNNGTVTPIPTVAPQMKDSVSFRLLEIGAHATDTFLAEVHQVKTYNNIIIPRIIEPDHLDGYMVKMHNSNQEENFITYIFCGLLIMMILYSLASFLAGKNTEFLLYIGYALFIGFMLFTKSFYYHRSYQKTFFYEAYLDFILQCIAICFYMAFMSKFLLAKKNYPFLYNLYKYSIVGLSLAMIIYTWLHYGTDLFYVQNLVENYITKGLLVILIIVFLVYALKQKQDKLLRYLFYGNLLYFIFSSISLAIILAPSLRHTLPPPFNSALLYYEIGLFVELAFFLMGLAYKNRKQIIEQTKERERLKMENERKELEKQMAVMAAHQEERNRISADMHDELGSGMTTIRLMSEIARSKMKDEAPVEIEKISHSANDLLNKMNAIIWSMNSGNDSVDNLVSYIRSYAVEYLDGTPIHCKVTIPDQIHHKDLSGDKRRNLFLCVKETLNNALKHSKATEIKIDIEVNSSLKIRIADNGQGIDLNHIRQFGNGLKNIRRRMESIGGSFDIQNQEGTVTTLDLPL